MDKRLLRRDSRRTWDENVITRYIKSQGRKSEAYEKIHETSQLELFA